MKRSGLRNRFSEDVRNTWLYWTSCMVCGKNQQDVLHHIVSPSVKHYVDGKHNTSVLNSCPIHNYKHPSENGSAPNCHIGNEAWLYSDEGVKTLLKKTKQALDEMFYEYTELDREFLRVYSHLYNC